MRFPLDGVSRFAQRAFMFDLLPPLTLALAFAIAFGAGTVKGVVGFAMPMILVSGLSSIMAPEIALAAFLLPTLVTNVWQAMRQGWQAAARSVRAFRVFLLAGGIALLLAAQLVPVLSHQVLLLMIGVTVMFFAAAQLLGWRPRLARRSARIDAAIGAFTGTLGGLSGIWGPPTVAYLTALDTPKEDQMRVQGTIYGLGAVLLVGAHLQSGVLAPALIPLSLAMVVPAMAGMWLGLQLQDRIDQALFRRITLIVLLIAAANLVRRGLVG